MYPGVAGCGLHDLLAVAQDPSLARTKRMLVEVALARGQTIADRRRTAVPLRIVRMCA
jgi:hypothetical protein